MNQVITTSGGRTVRVAHLIHGLDVGGLEQLVVRLSAASRAFGVESLVMALGEDGPVRDLLRDEGIPLVWFGGLPGLSKAALRRIAQECDAFGAHVLHGHDVGPWVNGAAARALMPRTRLVATIHQLQPLGGKQGIFAAAAAVMSGALVACGAAVQQNLSPLRNLVRLELIQNGVPLDESRALSREDARKALGLPAEARVYGYLGRLHAEKGVDLLVQAFCRAMSSNGRAHLVLVGSGPLEETLRAQVPQALRARVHFAGTRLEGARLLSALDVYVQPSRREGRSLSLLEAMAAGLPTVAHDLSEIREIHMHGETALLTPPEDVDALARAQRELYDDVPLGAKLGAAARRAVQEHSVEAMAENYCQLYRDVLTRAS